MIQSILTEKKLFIYSNSFWLIVSSFITGSLSFALVFLFPQETALKTVLAAFLSFIWVSGVFIFSKKGIMDRYEQFIHKNKVDFVNLSFLSLILPFFLISIIGETLTASTITIFLTWYILPISLMIIGLTISPSNPNRSIFIIISALLLWIGFDHRHTMVLFDSYQDLGYNLTTLWVVQLLLIIYAPFNQKETNKVNSKPTIASIKYSFLMIPLLLVVITPIGLATGFLYWNVDTTTEPWMKTLVFIAIYLTIALPEEFIFRGVVLNELDKKFKDPHTKRYTLLFVSFIFGLSHWNNTSPEYVWYYILFATCAGIAYGYVWRKSGLFGAAFLHAAVDWVWQFYLQ